MKLLRVPEILVGGLAALPELFLASAKWRRIRRQDVDEIVRLMPARFGKSRASPEPYGRERWVPGPYLSW